MAMSNTLGANTLDILMCLGLPWLIKTSITGKSVHIVSGALLYSVISIIICVVIFYTVVAFYKFQLNNKVGVICLLLNTIFIVFAILIELNVFFLANVPVDHCWSSLDSTTLISSLFISFFNCHKSILLMTRRSSSIVSPRALRRAKSTESRDREIENID